MTDIKLDDILVEVALRLSGHRDANEMVAHALSEYVDRLRHRELLCFLTDTAPFADGEEAVWPNGD